MGFRKEIQLIQKLRRGGFRRSKRFTVPSACSIVAAPVMLINFIITIYFKIRWKIIGDLGTIYSRRLPPINIDLIQGFM